MFSGRVFSLLCLLLMLPMLSLANETKEIPFTFKNAEPVIFSHEFHLGKYNNNCKICHNAIFNLKAKKRFTMSDMEKTRSCGACHTGVKAFSVKEEKSCAKCHKGKPRNISFKAKGATDAVFSHETHLAKGKFSCKACHGSIITGKDRGVTMLQMEKGKTCGACHNGKRAFTVAGNCGNCHKGMKAPQEITFKMKGISDAVFSHQVHLGMFKCPDCHTKIFQYKSGSTKTTMMGMEAGRSCGACHNGKDAFTVKGECDKCHKGYKPGDITFKTEAGEARFSHEFHLGIYKCPDCHTKIFPFKAGATKAKMEDMDKKGKSCGTCHNGKDAFKSSDDCVKCHKM